MTSRYVAIGESLGPSEQPDTCRIELANSESRFRTMFEAAPIGVALVESSSGQVRDVNKRFAEILGRTREEIAGGNWLDAAHPEDVGEIIDNMDRVRSGEVDDFRVTRRVVRPDGATAWVRLTVAKVPLSEGELAHHLCLLEEITERKRAEDALRESEEQFRFLAENSTDVVVLLGPHDVIKWVSPSITEVLGWQPQDWIGQRTTTFAHPDYVRDTASRLARVSGSRVRLLRERLRGADGLFHWVQIHARSHFDEAGKYAGTVASLRAVDAQVAVEQELERRARYDELTGLLNRKEMIDRVAEMSAGALQSNRATALLFCDVDELKSVNDTWGHSAGDEMLRVVAERIKASVRSSDVAGRIGGDEFLVILDGVDDLDDASTIARSICDSVAATPIQTTAGAIEARLSIGVTLRGAAENADALIDRADQALLQAKRTGRNRVIIIT